MSYDLTIKPRDSQPNAVERQRVESFIASLAGVRRDGENVFVYSDTQGRLFMSIYMDDTPKVEGVSVSVPAAFSGMSGEPALLLCFKVAEHFGWGVFDEQLGDFLAPDTLPQVLKSQRRYGTSGEEILRRRASGETGFWDCLFGYEILHHDKVSVISTLVLSVAVNVLLAVYAPGYAKSDFLVPLGFVVFWGILLGFKAVILTLWKQRRSAGQRSIK